MTIEKLGLPAAALIFASWAGSACANDSALDLALPASYYSQTANTFMIAEREADTIQIKNNISAAAPASESEPRLFSGKKIHQYLGVGTVALAGMTFMTHIHPVGNVPRDVNGTHAELGKATAVMALATVATGLIVHWDDFNLEDGWKDPDNLHVLLGVTGAALMAYAVNKSMNTSAGQASHAGMAELGALGMVVAVKLTW